MGAHADNLSVNLTLNGATTCGTHSVHVCVAGDAHSSGAPEFTHFGRCLDGYCTISFIHLLSRRCDIFIQILQTLCMFVLGVM